MYELANCERPQKPFITIVMSIISDIFNLLIPQSESYYTKDAIAWGNEVWGRQYDKTSGVLSLFYIDNALYYRLKIDYTNGVVGVFTNTNNRGFYVEYEQLSRDYQKQLKDCGEIIIKWYHY